MTQLDEQNLPEDEGQFAEAMDAAGVMDWLLDRDAPAEPVEDSEDTAEGQPRDPDTGRFLPQAEEETPEEGESTDEGPAAQAEDTPEPEEQEGGDDDALLIEYDDEIEEILQRYGGDLNKALRSLKEAQSEVGRKGNEIGELKAQLQDLAQLIQQGQVNQIRHLPYQNDIDENPQGLFYEALERGDSETIQASLRAWGDEDPFGATMALVGIMNAPNLAQGGPVGQPQQPPVTHEQAMAGVVERHPDVEQYLPDVEKIGAEFPTLRGALASDDPAVSVQAFEELLVLAKSRRTADTSKDAMRRVVMKQAEEVRTEKSDARVVSASKQSAAKDEKKADMDAFFDSFNQAAGRYLETNWLTRASDE